MTKNIFLDLDGTLLDVRKRLYNLFQELVPQSKFTFDEYWELKRTRINQEQLLSKWFEYSEEEISAFEKLWVAKIEDDERLQLDEPFAFVAEFLEEIFKKNTLYIVTGRQYPERVLGQIENFGWGKYFEKILVTEQSKSKFELIKNNIDVSSEDIFIGDTGEDILTGKKLGIKTIAVTSGIFNKEVLSEYDPDLIINNVEEIYINNRIL